MNTETTVGAGPVDQRVKPCPFCGGSSGGDEQGETYRWRLWRCAECGACGPETRCNITGSGQGGVKEARQLAMQAWNERTEPADVAVLQFLTDVVTAAGLLTHGKTDKALARRIGDAAFAMRGRFSGLNTNSGTGHVG